ncbi:hypothetical protein ACFE04_030766 [Oxalis oulophora]
MALAQVSTSISLYNRDACVIKSASPKRCSNISGLSLNSSFATKPSAFIGSPLLISGVSCLRSSSPRRPASVSIRCEQSSQGLDTWLGRFAMVGFAVAITVEVSTGKGLLENFGLTSPLPTVSLGVTALVGVLTAVFIFQSASKN